MPHGAIGFQGLFDPCYVVRLRTSRRSLVDLYYRKCAASKNSGVLSWADNALIALKCRSRKQFNIFENMLAVAMADPALVLSRSTVHLPKHGSILLCNR